MSTVERRSKTCVISVFLFGKPDWELDSGGQEATIEMAAEIGALGEEMKERLHYASETLAKLLGNGWSGSGTLYDIILFKDVSVEEAERELAALGIDKTGVDVREDEWETKTKAPDGVEERSGLVGRPA